MTGILNLLLANAIPVPGTDPYFNYTTLLLPGNGTNGGQNNTFLDSGTANSGSGFTITRNGNTTQGTFSPFSQTGWGNYFLASNSDVISLGTLFLNSISSSTATFTMEAWVYLNSFGTNATSFYNRTILAKGQIYLNFGIDQNGKLMLYHYDGTSRTNASTNAISLNTWTHVAAVVNGSGTITFYINGVANGTATWYGHTGTNQTARLGGTQDSTGGVNNYWNGYISNVRTTSTQVYTSNFTPSTTPLTAITGTTFLSCQSNRFVDNSSNGYTLTIAAGTPSVQAFSPFAPTAEYSASTVGGSGYFDGTGDYLSTPDADALDLSTGDFTIQGWIYALSDAADLDGIIGKRSSSVFAGWRIAFDVTSSVNKIDINHSGDGTERKTPAINKNEWVHFAFTRTSGTLRCYANGVLGDSVAGYTYDFSNTYEVVIGSNAPGNNLDFPGYITGVQILKGTSLYSGSTYTVPTSPPTNITNTSLLLNFTNAAIIDNTAKNDLETVGNAQISTTQSKFGGASLYFDGTGDYLVGLMTPNLVFGSGNMTFECWVYANTISGFDTIFDTRTSGGYGNEAFSVFLDGGIPKLFAGSYSGASPVIAGSSAISASTWTHIAFTRSSGTNYLFVNGTSITSNSNSWNQTLVTTNNFRIGEQVSGDVRPFDGYIDDLRITKGIARYTSNFTPPTSAFPLL